MSTEGGPFECSTTGEQFERSDRAGWNNHCETHKGFHNMSGTTVCFKKGCEKQLRFKNLPYIPLDVDTPHLEHPVMLYCDEHDNGQNPRNTEIELITGETVTHKDSQAT